MEEIKVIGTASEMSNLVGMYAVNVVNEKIHHMVKVIGKADNQYFICQFISPLTGEPNVSKLITLDQLKDWYVIHTYELFSQITKDSYKYGWRYGVKL